MPTVTPDTRQLAKQTRFNPLRSLTPAVLTTALDSFETGWLRQASLLWDAMEARDPVLCGAAGKRKRSVSRRPWEIVKTEETPEADKQKQALEYFFNNLTARHALRGNVRGGVSLLIKQMMDSVFKRYAVHELVWKPGPDGLTAEAVFVPLWFFEETTGELRYTGPLYNSTGQPLKAGEWMVTAGDGIMESISVAYIFKKLSLEDWINFSEKFGMPGVHGMTDAAKGSAEWDDFANALASFANDWCAATNKSGEIKLIESSRTGDQPFEPMVERMERTIVALCRGADLGTLSSKDGAGASLQGDEGSLLEEDDCETIGETLQSYLAEPALKWLFGPRVKIQVKVRIIPSANQDVQQERQTDEMLIKHGVPISKTDLAERYGRTMADDDAKPEDIAGAQGRALAPQAQPSGKTADGGPSALPEDEDAPPDDSPQPGTRNQEPGTREAANTADFERTLVDALIEGLTADHAGHAGGSRDGLNH